MSVHPAGDGVSWDSDVDVDQPHGLDYRYTNHVAKAVQKRSDKEHVGFADATVGGEHKPGGCAILGIVDSTADMTVGISDSSIDVTTGSFIGRGLIYDQTNSSLWCWTADGTTAGNPYQLMWGPDSICEGADFTWTGAHQYESTVDFFDEIDCSAMIIEGTVDVYDEMDVSTLTVEGTADFLDEVDISTLIVDASLDVGGNAYFASDVDVTGTLSLLTSTKASAGYTYLPNGLILQWGTDLTFKSQNRELTFPIAFPNNVWSVTATRGDVTQQYNNNTMAVHDISLEGFDLYDNGELDHVTNYFAIGN